MLDNLQFDYEPNDDDEEYASAYDLYLHAEDDPVGVVFVRDEFNSGGVAHLFKSSPKLLSTVRRFVQWADNLTKGRRPHLDPIVADARVLLAELDN